MSGAIPRSAEQAPVDGHALRAPRARRAVSLRTRGGGLAAAAGLGAGLACRGGGGKRVWQRGLAHTTYGLASTSSLAVLPISSEIERDEQDEVRAENSNAGDRGEFLAGALAHVRPVGEVDRGEVGVRRKVDESWFRVSWRASWENMGGSAYQDQ